MSTDPSPRPDLSHHLSRLSKSRAESPLKGLQRYLGKPGLIQLAGGMPSPSYFPFANIKGDGLIPESFPLAPTYEEVGSFSWIWDLLSGPNKEKTMPVNIPKYPVKPDDVNLAVSLQYGLSKGLLPLQDLVKDFARKFFSPAYPDFAVLVHTGNTDGWYKAVMTLCNPGEGVIVAELTYPSAVNVMIPNGVTPVPVPMDSQGIRADTLRQTLSEWDEAARGIPRPHVMYVVPVGQNPTGVTMGTARKKVIYDVCVEFDIIIVEDDPYYFLQEGDYVPRSDRKKVKSLGKLNKEEKFLAGLVPSFLKFDYQGRVIRLDTFSKTIAPGCRLGWFTCNPMFAERLERQSEGTTQAPCGFGQSLVTKLLLEWKYEGYIRWLRALGAQYTMRRDYFIDCLAEEFHLERTSYSQGIWEGADVYLASRRRDSLPSTDMKEKFSGFKTMFSFIPPTSGMFVWLKLHLENCPRVPKEGDDTLEMQLFFRLAEENLLVGPGRMFVPGGNPDAMDGHFRVSFSNAEFDDMKRATAILGKVFREFWAEP